VRPARFPALSLWLLPGACSEYSLGERAKDEVPATDSGRPPEPVDSGTPPPRDTGAPPRTTEDGVPVATAPLYAHTRGELFTIDVLTGAATRVGPFATLSGEPLRDVVDIAIDLDGRLYGGTYDALYRIDPTTAQVNKVCDLDFPFTAMTFSSAGVLYVGSGSVIERVDVAACALDTLVRSSRYTTSGDLVGLPDGYLYWTVLGEGDDELVRIDPLTGLDTWIGVTGAQQLFGLGYQAAMLFGFSAQGGVVRISPVDASSAALGAGEGAEAWWGATTNPVTW
jgi:hypothetical protein